MSSVKCVTEYLIILLALLTHTVNPEPILTPAASSHHHHQGDAKPRDFRAIDHHPGYQQQNPNPNNHHHPQQQQPNIDWEPGLREALYQALLRERNRHPELRQLLAAAPLDDKSATSATPFGDIAVLARGQLFVQQHGERLRLAQDRCEAGGGGGLSNGERFGRHHPRNSRCLGVKNHGPEERLLALWTVKRIRHRDNQGYRYELEYTVSPMSVAISEGFVTRNGGFDYTVPGHVFIVKTGRTDYENLVHYKTYEDNPNRQYLPSGQQPQPQNYYGSSSSISSTEYPKITTESLDDKEVDLYKKLIQTLHKKTTHRFAPPTRTTATTSSVGPLKEILPIPTLASKETIYSTAASSEELRPLTTATTLPILSITTTRKVQFKPTTATVPTPPTFIPANPRFPTTQVQYTTVPAYITTVSNYQSTTRPFATQSSFKPSTQFVGGNLESGEKTSTTALKNYYATTSSQLVPTQSYPSKTTMQVNGYPGKTTIPINAYAGKTTIPINAYPGKSTIPINAYPSKATIPINAYPSKTTIPTNAYTTGSYVVPTYEQETSKEQYTKPQYSTISNYPDVAYYTTEGDSNEVTKTTHYGPSPTSFGPTKDQTVPTYPTTSTNSYTYSPTKEQSYPSTNSYSKEQTNPTSNSYSKEQTYPSTNSYSQEQTYPSTNPYTKEQTYPSTNSYTYNPTIKEQSYPSITNTISYNTPPSDYHYTDTTKTSQESTVEYQLTSQEAQEDSDRTTTHYLQPHPGYTYTKPPYPASTLNPGPESTSQEDSVKSTQPEHSYIETTSSTGFYQTHDPPTTTLILTTTNKDRYFPETTPQYINVAAATSPDRRPQTGYPFKENPFLGEDVDVFPPEEKKTSTTTEVGMNENVTIITTTPEPFLIDKVGDKVVEKGTPPAVYEVFEKVVETQPPEEVEVRKPTVDTKEIDEIFGGEGETPTTSKSMEEEEENKGDFQDLFGVDETATTEASVEKTTRGVKIIYSDFFAASTTSPIVASNTKFQDSEREVVAETTKTLVEDFRTTSASDDYTSVGKTLLEDLKTTINNETTRSEAIESQTSISTSISFQVNLNPNTTTTEESSSDESNKELLQSIASNEMLSTRKFMETTEEPTKKVTNAEKFLSTNEVLDNLALSVVNNAKGIGYLQEETTTAKPKKKLKYKRRFYNRTRKPKTKSVIN